MSKVNELVKALGMSTGAPPGPPPRPGLEWNSQSHRWIRPKTKMPTSLSDKDFQEMYEMLNKLDAHGLVNFASRSDLHRQHLVETLIRDARDEDDPILHRREIRAAKALQAKDYKTFVKLAEMD